ncbi:hypothetical protein CMI46_02930 [Candidatus Pacearchaeota archaeon]|nr:hypothetical protein [Candidatus Pacearchaeota archaeon]|tara:strand:- start:2421 stop:2999 length:579 start_codon:yes stop_codon:yes gene_type:complete
MQIKNLIIGAAITFLTFLVIFTGVQTFYPSPDWDDFCDEKSIHAPKLAEDRTLCAQDAQQCPNGSFVGRDPSNNCEFFQCNQENEFETCRNEFDTVNESYTKNLFIVTLILGILLLLLGGKLFNLEAVGAGIMGGGIITLIYGSGAYWQYAGDMFRFILSIIALIAVIYLAYWLNKKTHKKKKKLKFSLGFK